MLAARDKTHLVSFYVEKRGAPDAWLSLLQQLGENSYIYKGYRDGRHHFQLNRPLWVRFDDRKSPSIFSLIYGQTSYGTMRPLFTPNQAALKYRASSDKVGHFKHTTSGSLSGWSIYTRLNELLKPVMNGSALHLVVSE